MKHIYIYIICSRFPFIKKTLELCEMLFKGYICDDRGPTNLGFAWTAYPATKICPNPFKRGHDNKNSPKECFQGVTHVNLVDLRTCAFRNYLAPSMNSARDVNQKCDCGSLLSKSSKQVGSMHPPQPHTHTPTPPHAHHDMFLKCFWYAFDTLWILSRPL